MRKQRGMARPNAASVPQAQVRPALQEIPREPRRTQLLPEAPGALPVDPPSAVLRTVPVQPLARQRHLPGTARAPILQVWPLLHFPELRDSAPLCPAWLLLPFRRISDCLSPLKIFRLEETASNCFCAGANAGGRHSFRENESIVTACTGAPSVPLPPGTMPAAAIASTVSRPEVTLPTTV